MPIYGFSCDNPLLDRFGNGLCCPLTVAQKFDSKTSQGILDKIVFLIWLS